MNNKNYQEKKPKHSRGNLKEKYQRLLEKYNDLKEEKQVLEQDFEEMESLHDCLCEDFRTLEQQLKRQESLTEVIREQRDHWRNKCFEISGVEPYESEEMKVEPNESEEISEETIRVCVRSHDERRDKKILELLGIRRKDQK